MSDGFQVPEALLAWLNGRLEATEQPVVLNSLHLDGDGACRLTGTVKKFGISADMEIRFRIDGKDKKLLIHDVEIATTNPIGKTLLPQMKTVLLSKGRQALAPHGIEIVEIK